MVKVTSTKVIMKTSQPTITEIMRLLQFGDSTLPVGAFSFSNGLESAIQVGVVHDLTTLREFVRASVKQAATSDGIAVLIAFRSAQVNDSSSIDRADRAVYNRKLNEEVRTMTVRMGRKLAQVCDRVSASDVVSSWRSRIEAGKTPGCYPVGQGLVFAGLGLSEQDAFAVHQYGIANMMISASLRLMKLHYLDAQAVLSEVNSEAQSDYQQVADKSLEDMMTFAPTIDILASVHVQAKVRMFMN